MQDLINLSLYEIRRDEMQQAMARVNSEAWKKVAVQSGRVALAKALIALATWIAPTATVSRHTTRAVAP